MQTLLISHRGDTINFPENTIEAFKSSFEKGADGIELDIQFFQGELIVVHNYLFDKNKKYPLLPGVLELFSEKGRIEIEIKCLDLDFLLPLLNLLNKYKKSDIEITTSVYPIVVFLRKEFPEVNLGVIFGDKEFEEWMPQEFINLKVINAMKLFKANVAHIPWKFVNKKLVEECHKNKIKVHSHIYKVGLPEELTIYNSMGKLGVDQATFDDISLLQHGLRAKFVLLASKMLECPYE